MAKTLLEGFSQDESLRPYVEQAIENALQPRMIAPLVIAGIVIIALAAMPKKIKKGDTEIEFGQLRDAAEFLKALPDGITTKLLGS